MGRLRQGALRRGPSKWWTTSAATPTGSRFPIIGSWRSKTASQVPMAGLPRQQSAENYDSLGRRVHSAIPPPRSPQWIPPHSLLRVPGQSIPQREVGPLPPTPGHNSQRKLFSTAAMPRLSGSIRKAHRSLSEGMPGLPSWQNDYGPVIAQSSCSPGHPRSLWLIPCDSKSSFPQTRCHRVEGVVLPYGHFDCPAINQAVPILPNSCSPKPMNTVHGLVPIHHLRFVLPTWNPVFAIQNP
jgi:hypothetical protein